MDKEGYNSNYKIYGGCFEKTIITFSYVTINGSNYVDGLYEKSRKYTD